MIIGIIGETGSGKSTCIKQLTKKMKGYHIDGDKIGHQVLEDQAVIQILYKRYGDRVMDDDKISRKELGNIVFSNPDELEFLNKLTHPLIKDRINSVIQNKVTEYSYFFMEGIALIEAGLSELCDLVIYITAPENIRLNRLIKGRKIEPSRAKMMIKAQKDSDFFKHHAHCMFDTSLNSEKVVDEIMHYIRSTHEASK